MSYHTAFEYHGVANQVFYELHFTSQKRLYDFSYDGIQYKCLLSRGSVGIVENPAGVRITTPERTVIDSIASFEKSRRFGRVIAMYAAHPLPFCRKVAGCFGCIQKRQAFPDNGLFVGSFSGQISFARHVLFYMRKTLFQQ